RPTRNTARISAKVYTVAPKCSDSSRVHTTSDASAVIPDSAMATYTAPVPFVRDRVSTGTKPTACGGSYSALVDTRYAAPATSALSATATNVATFTSNTRSR